ncbi:flagellar biosynthesis anti-sigma factor FlgM [Roseovarius aquimarinus]|uniref:Negative regulator of flagellin synthesis n=1 Tax=Roseovarius aquimarinus TaxID=1229156 RepID=A0ABW7I739_9RHOB
MVDAVNSSGAARLRLMSVQTDSGAQGVGNARHGQPVGAPDKVRQGDAASIQTIQRLTEAGPPFDAERVGRIKEALAEGRYPIDAGAITESIFQDYSALMR